MWPGVDLHDLLAGPRTGVLHVKGRLESARRVDAVGVGFDVGVVERGVAQAEAEREQRNKLALVVGAVPNMDAFAVDMPVVLAKRGRL